MNSITASQKRSFSILFAYTIFVLVMLGGYLSGSLQSMAPEGVVRDFVDCWVFAAVAIGCVCAIQFGATPGLTVSVGTWGAFVALTAQQEPLIRFLTFGAVLFAIGMYGMVVSRNAVRVLMSIELMLNAVNINLVAFARYVDPINVKGQIFAIFVLAVAAAEAAVGLAIVLAIYRNMATVDMDRFNLLKW